MFFRKEKTPTVTFADYLERLRGSGYTVDEAGGDAKVSKGRLGAVLHGVDGAAPVIDEVGLVLGSEIAVLTDLGYQKIFLSPSGKKTPALAEHLSALHAFDEDLRAALGITSLFNQGLGTTNELHLYDRVEDRDEGTPRRPWEAR